MSGKRVTIYHIAEQLGMSASYVSRALNNHPLVSKEVVELVKKKAAELKYRQNSHAANLRRGSSKTMGVIVPHINQSFFSDAIAGIEEVCAANNYSLIICQSHESYQQECMAIETLIHQNVDCILISISAETQSDEYLRQIAEHNIQLIQFDRCLGKMNGYKVINDNREASYFAVQNLIREKYRSIAFIGGPEHLAVFQLRKDGYLQAMREAKLNIPYNFVVDNAFTQEGATKVATELMQLPVPPDAFFTVSDHQALGVLQAADSLGLQVPKELGIFGFANEAFTELIKPSLSSIDQQSKELGRQAASLYFQHRHKKNAETEDVNIVIQSSIIARQSSLRSGIGSGIGQPLFTGSL